MAAYDWSSCLFEDDVASLTCIEPLLKNIFQSVAAFVSVAFFIVLLIGGFSFLFSSGDPKRLEQAKGTISKAITGLVIIVSAYLILRIIESFTGATNLTTFKLPLF